MGHPPGVRLSASDDRLEGAYRTAEGRLDAYYATRRRRGPVVLLGTLLALTLGVGVIAAVDLRRLQTPRGTALAWTGAAVFGDCEAYERLSVRDPDAVQPERRTDSEVCRDLNEQTAEARENASRIGIEVRTIEQDGREATVGVELRRPDGTDRVDLPLVRRGDGWAVVRTPDVCLAVGCA